MRSSFPLVFLLLISASSSVAQNNRPILISQTASTRAIAFESPSLTTEPFKLRSSVAWSIDQRTRVMLFALNLTLLPGDDLTALAADAEDSQHHISSLQVEYLGPVPGQDWLTAIVFRLSDDLDDVGDVLVRVKYRGAASNRVRIALGHIGGGPPDDPGSDPTPAPPYVISGRVFSQGVGLSGVALSLGGSQNGITQTDSSGAYSFTVTRYGNYAISASTPFYNFSPQILAIDFLTGNLANLNFDARRIDYTISGRLKDGTSGLAGMAVTVTGNSIEQTVTTDLQGEFSFSNLEAGYSYTVSSPGDNVFAFSLQVIPSLTSNLQLDFPAARRTYTITGHAKEGTRPIGDAIVTLSSEGSANTVTDAAGAFSFPNLQAGRTYTITPTKPYFEFAPPSQHIESLQANQTIDLEGTLSYHLTGRVTDENGSGLANVTMTMAGAEEAALQTANDGTYSFTVHKTGDYSLIASMDQNYYSFSPAEKNLPEVDGDRTADFTGALSLATDPSYVLEFDGTPKTVDAGFFWPPVEPLGHFFWEVWATPGPGAGATYLISDGYGGAHALLFGFGFYGASEPGRYQLFGDLWDGTTWTFFSSNEGPAIGEWAHLAVGWDGHQVITYFNGVPVGRSVFSGPRISPDGTGGGGRLLIGGSDHNNLVGRIAQVRGYEDANPREASSVTAVFAPQPVFSRDGAYLSYFFRPSLKIADMSHYYRGEAHRSRLRGTLFPYGLLTECPDCPLPIFVIDPLAPNFLNSPVNNSAPVSPASPAPIDAVVFDSFSRANSTYTFQIGGLSSTEGGSAGPKPWQTNQIATDLKPFGILNGHAVVLANEMAVAWAETGSSSGNLSVQVNRRPGSWGSGYDTGLAFRVVDARNFFFAFTSGSENDPFDARKLTVGYYLNGVRTDLVTNVSLSSNWTTLGVTTNANGQINVLTDGGIVYSLNNNLMTNATAAGLYNNGPGLGLLNRWDNFTVYNTP